MIRQYSSFEEVDQQLKILRLQRDISAERIKLDVNQVVSDIRIYPLKFIERLSGALQKVFLVIAIRKLRGFIGK